MTDDYNEWHELCRDYNSARDAVYEALGPVNQKFSAIGEGTGHTNPSDEELDKLDEAWSSWEDAKNNMKEFIKKRR
ncbi:MAG: hypothetical protein ACC641_02130 [Acidiferrobacterales bacterium]